jgi:hypothetical protein
VRWPGLGGLFDLCQTISNAFKKKRRFDNELHKFRRRLPNHVPIFAAIGSSPSDAISAGVSFDVRVDGPVRCGPSHVEPAFIVAGLLLGLGSALLWYIGSVLSLVLPNQQRCAAFSNLLAAGCAGAAAGYVTPDDKLAVLWALLSSAM